jgi:hypothetical protein
VIVRNTLCALVDPIDNVFAQLAMGYRDRDVFHSAPVTGV